MSTDEHHDNRYEDGEPIPRTDWSFDPWWGEMCLADAERERLARQQDKREAEEFFA